MSAEGFNPDWIIDEPAPQTPTEPDEDSDEDYQPLILNNVEIPRGAAATIRSMSPEARKAWDADREACLTDQLALSRVCGYDLTENPHRAMFNFFMKRTPLGTPLSQLDPIVKKRMCLLPRGLGKTFGIRVQEVFLILRFPTIRICFLTGGENLGKRQLVAVKNVFKKPTKEFKRLFPEFCTISKKSKKGVWTDTDQCDWGNAHEFSVPARGESILAEPTFCISTARSVNSGSHFDIIVIDDLVNDSNWNSPKLLESCYSDYLSICPLLDPQGYMLMTGTRYAIGDTYERIQENARETEQAGQFASVWAFLIRDCWSQDCSNPNCKHAAIFHNHNGLLAPCTMDGCNCSGFVADGEKKCLFPAVPKKTSGDTFGHTLEFLAKTLAEQGKQFFACQYLNAPEQDGSQIFTQQLIDSVTIDISKLPPRATSSSYLCGDMAYSVATKANYSVILAFQKSGGAHYLWGCWYGKFTASDRADLVLRTIATVRPETFFIERNMNSDSFALNLAARMPEVGLAKLPIIWTDLSTKKDAKQDRIADIELAMKGRRFFIVKQMQGSPGAFEKLVQQLLRFPNCGAGGDDFADCAGMIVSAPTNYLSEALPQTQPQSMNSWLNKLHRCAEPDDSYGDNGCGSGLVC